MNTAIRNINTLYVSIILTAACLLLFPSVSGLSIFSKGDFLYIESIALILFYIALLFTIISYTAHNLPKHKLGRIISSITICCIGIFVTLIIISAVWIRFDVKTNCQNAKRQYGGDCAKALVQVVNDEKNSYRERNSAIWALGMLGEVRSLSSLNNLYTSTVPKREPLDQVISQYELQKAINLINSEKNLFAILWRHGIN